MQQTNALNPGGLVAVIALAVIVVAGSNKKWRTVLVILGWMAIGFAVGAGIGFALGTGAAGGTAVGLSLL